MLLVSCALMRLLMSSRLSFAGWRNTWCWPTNGASTLATQLLATPAQWSDQHDTSGTTSVMATNVFAHSSQSPNTHRPQRFRGPPTRPRASSWKTGVTPSPTTTTIAPRLPPTPPSFSHVASFHSLHIIPPHPPDSSHILPHPPSTQPPTCRWPTAGPGRHRPSASQPGPPPFPRAACHHPEPAPPASARTASSRPRSSSSSPPPSPPPPRRSPASGGSRTTRSRSLASSSAANQSGPASTAPLPSGAPTY
jgi:hypothetical protein